MAPPANDNFADAQVITGLSGTVEGSTWESTDETSEPDSGNGGVWYSFNPPTSGIYKFLIDRVSAGFYFKLYTGSDVTTLTEFPERDYHTAGGYDLNSGTTYYIKVIGNTTRFLLHWKYYPPADNDDFADATVLTGASGVEPYVLITAGVETDDPDNVNTVGFSNATVWFKWVATATGILRVFTENTYKIPLAADYTRALGVYRGTALASLTHITYQEFMFGNFYEFGGVDGPVFNIVDAAVVAGTTYYIEIGNDSQAVLDGGGYLHWHLYPETLWDGEWGRPPVATPNPGTNATAFPAYRSASHVLHEFQGSVTPTPDDSDGFAWRDYPGSTPVAAITSEGLKGEVIAPSSYGTDFEFLIAPSTNVPGWYTPHEGGTWEIGFFTNGLKWIDDSSTYTGYAEINMFPVINTSLQNFEKGPVLVASCPGPDSHDGYWFIADGRKYRYRVVYEIVDGIPPYGYPVGTTYLSFDGVTLESVDTSWEDSTLNVERGLIVGRTSGLCGARFSVVEPADCDFTMRGFKLGDALYSGLRVSAASGTDFDGYFAKIHADGKVSLVKRVGGTETVFGTTSNVIFEDSFSDSQHGLILRCKGNQISVWHERGAGSMESELLVSATDTTFTGTGHKAILINSSGDFDSGIIRFGDTATYAQSIVRRYRGYISADAGATWELFHEQLIDSSQILTYESRGFGGNDFYISDLMSDGSGWSITMEGWSESGPPPVERPNPATQAGLYAVYHNGAWHIHPSNTLP